MAGDIVQLQPLREELDLLPGPSAFDGAPTWSLYDPANQHYYRIGKTECEIIMAWGRIEPEAVVYEVNKSGLVSVTEDDVISVYQFLLAHNLVQRQGSEATQHLLKQANAAKQHWLTWLIHHYLFFKVPLLRPDSLLKKAYPYIKFIYKPITLYLFIALLMLNLYVLVDRWDIFTSTFLHFFSVEGFAYYFLALTVSKIVHEMGHAFTAYRYGCRVATMGVAFLVMFPMLYTDTSDAWKLTSRRQRLAIGAGGMVAELALAIICTSLWHFLPDGVLRSSVFLMASTTWIMTLLVNLNPFMRFDGYFLLSDFLGIENLQNRSFNLGKWQLRRILFALQDPVPEHLPYKMQRTLIIYAWGTWLYRFLLFLGIALLVYHLFFKVLGLILMLVEIVWFIGLPIYKEVKYWLSCKEKMEWNKNSLITALVTIVMIGVLFIPWQSRVEAPAVLKAGKQTEMYLPFAGRLNSILVRRGEFVEAGQLLVKFSSADLDSQISQSKEKVKVLRWQLEFHGQSKQLNEYSRITKSELGRALSEYKSLLDKRNRLLIHASFSGVVLEINELLDLGQWVSKDEHLLTLAQIEHYNIEAYVEEHYLGQVLESQHAVFYPDQLDWPSVGCKIIRINNAASHQIEPIFASRYLGDIPVKTSSQYLIPENAVFRVSLQAEKQGAFINRAIRGSIMIDAPAESIASILWKKVVIVLIRESGF